MRASFAGGGLVCACPCSNQKNIKLPIKTTRSFFGMEANVLMGRPEITECADDFQGCSGKRSRRMKAYFNRPDLESFLQDQCPRILRAKAPADREQAKSK